MQRLPIHEVLPQLRAVLAASQTAVLSAPPGSGKSTIVPLELLDAPWLQGRGILLLEPRRLAARAVAARMADLLNEPLGERVGYRIRFERRVSERTRIEVVTEGILTRRLQHDPELAGVGLVIFDEFHERSLHADLALALALDVIGGLRDDLRLLVMSATLDSAAVSTLLGGAPVVSGEGRSFPVEVRYLEREPQADPLEIAEGGVRRALRETPGDLLVFLPGGGEIRALSARLTRDGGLGAEVLPLYGDLERAAQQRAILPDPDGRRRVVLATSIAETSLTIEGVTTVVDSGWSRVPAFDPESGLGRLETVRVSQAAAEQRAGRAGRLGPGFCYRLWTPVTHTRLPKRQSPEMLVADLAPLALELANWGVDEPRRLRWLDPPPAGAYAQARELLQELAALDGAGRITPEGQRMVELGLHPRLAHLLLQAEGRGQRNLAADLAALLSERDPLRRGPGLTPSCDIEERLRLLDSWRREGNEGARRAGGDPAACRRIEEASRRWRAGNQSAKTPAGCSIGGLLALAYPDRIAQRRGAEAWSYRLANGRGARLPEGDILQGSQYLVAAHLDAGHREGRIFLAAAVAPQELRELLPQRLTREESVQWDPASRAVLAVRRECLGALVLSQTPLRAADPEALRQAMLEGVRALGLGALPWDEGARELRARLEFLRRHQPEAGWPDLSDAGLLENLAEWLGPWLDGISRADHLTRLDLTAILRGWLDWPQQQALEQLAPTHFQVPSGSRKRIQYLEADPPVLAVRLQEMFGLLETPRILGGRVALRLHLLSPAQRPIQVTQDLKGFWERTYAEVKKELKGRYPKHYWPDDPWSARPPRGYGRGRIEARAGGPKAGRLSKQKAERRGRRGGAKDAEEERPWS